MDVRLDGRTAVITGASEGLGLAMAQEFAASGANVAMIARSADTLEAARESVVSAIGSNSVRVEAFPCDVTDVSQIESTWAGITDAFGEVTQHVALAEWYQRIGQLIR